MKESFGYQEAKIKRGLLGTLMALFGRIFKKSASKRQMRVLMGVNTRISSGRPFAARGAVLK